MPEYPTKGLAVYLWINTTRVELSTSSGKALASHGLSETVGSELVEKLSAMHYPIGEELRATRNRKL